MTYKQRTMGALFGSFFTVLIVNKTLLRNYPKIPVMRPLIFSSKYIGIPLLSFYLTRIYACKDVENTFANMAEKYQFGFKDYNRAMDIMERAYRANRFQEFIEKGR